MTNQCHLRIADAMKKLLFNNFPPFLNEKKIEADHVAKASNWNISPNQLKNTKIYRLFVQKVVNFLSTNWSKPTNLDKTFLSYIPYGFLFIFLFITVLSCLKDKQKHKRRIFKTEPQKVEVKRNENSFWNYFWRNQKPFKSNNVLNHVYSIRLATHIFHALEPR